MPEAGAGIAGSGVNGRGVNCGSGSGTGRVGVPGAGGTDGAGSGAWAIKSEAEQTIVARVEKGRVMMVISGNY